MRVPSPPILVANSSPAPSLAGLGPLHRIQACRFATAADHYLEAQGKASAHRPLDGELTSPGDYRLFGGLATMNSRPGTTAPSRRNR